MAKRPVVEYSHAPEDDPKKFLLGLKRGLRAATEYWHRHMAKKHFRAGAKAKYGYAERSQAHNRRKRRLYGHAQPLVFSGQARRWITTRLPPGRVRKTSKGWQGRVAISAPKYFYQYRKDYGQPDKAAELTTTTEQEAAELQGVIEQELELALAPGRKKRKVL